MQYQRKIQSDASTQPCFQRITQLASFSIFQATFGNVKPHRCMSSSKKVLQHADSAYLRQSLACLDEQQPKCMQRV
jgi:hypothetical protein